jgi:hypothetical protein
MRRLHALIQLPIPSPIGMVRVVASSHVEHLSARPSFETHSGRLEPITRSNRRSYFRTASLKA